MCSCVCACCGCVFVQGKNDSLLAAFAEGQVLDLAVAKDEYIFPSGNSHYLNPKNAYCICVQNTKHKRYNLNYFLIQNTVIGHTFHWWKLIK